jgi:hypothetical protein
MRTRPDEGGENACGQYQIHILELSLFFSMHVKVQKTETWMITSFFHFQDTFVCQFILGYWAFISFNHISPESRFRVPTPGIDRDVRLNKAG